MDNFTVIYKILRELESALDEPKVDQRLISSEHFNITQIRWMRYLEMMADIGLIKGFVVKRYSDGGFAVLTEDISITLKGLEYLTENSIMRKIYETVKKVKDITPFI